MKKERIVNVKVIKNCTEEELLTSVAWDICKIIQDKENQKKQGVIIND